jgi:hypothetical protein
MVRLLSLAIVLATFSVACQSAEDRARAEFRTRLKREARLTPQELQRVFDEIAPVIAGKSVRVREGAITRQLNEEQRLSVLGVLTDPSAVYDAGLKMQGTETWRGLKTGGTPVMSEIDAMQTLWIDVETLLPRRYECEYSTPGLGDYAYDLTFGQ